MRNLDSTKNRYFHPSKGFLTLVCLLAAALSAFQMPVTAAAQAAPLAGPQDPVELEAFLDGLMDAQMAANHIPGAVISVVKDGDLFITKGYGVANLETGLPVDPERTLFRPGSISKLFVWTAVMQLVEQGRLSLEADVNTYIDYTIPATFPEPITLRHLMTHTPGFEDKGENLFKIDPQEMMPLDEYLKTNLPERVFPPGRLGAYSNYGTALAGYIVERVSGMPFDAYIEENILDPLGMARSTFRQPLPDHLASDMSRAYNFFNGGYVEGDFEFVVAAPAGALSATATDMAKFMIAHLQNGQYQGVRILEEDTAAQMHAPAFSHDPRLDGMTLGFFENTIHGRRIISHGGDTLLFHSGLFLIPSENVGLYISNNGAGGGSIGMDVLKAFMDRYYPGEEPEGLPQTAPSPAGFGERIEPYLGEYIPARSNFTTFEKLISLFSMTGVRLNDEGYLAANVMGEMRQFVELEPGLLQDRLDPDYLLLYRTGEDGRAYLLPAEPFAFIKQPWYGTTSFQSSLLVISLLFFLGALIGWPVAALATWRKQSPRPLLPRLARWAAGIFCLVCLIFLVSLVSIFGEINPAYGAPNIFFDNPPGMNVLMALPPVLAFLGAAMAVFSVLAWVKRFWGVGGRVFYTLLTLAALSFLWQLSYWNILF